MSRTRTYEEMAQWGRDHQSLAAAESRRKGLARAQTIMNLHEAGFTYADIALALGISKGAAATALHRAKKLLAPRVGYTHVDFSSTQPSTETTGELS